MITQKREKLHTVILPRKANITQIALNSQGLLFSCDLCYRKYMEDESPKIQVLFFFLSENVHQRVIIMLLYRLSERVYTVNSQNSFLH